MKITRKEIDAEGYYVGAKTDESGSVKIDGPLEIDGELGWVRFNSDLSVTKDVSVDTGTSLQVGGDFTVGGSIRVHECLDVMGATNVAGSLVAGIHSLELLKLYSALPERMRQDPNVSGLGRLVYFAIAAREDGDGECCKLIRKAGYFAELLHVDKSEVEQCLYDLDVGGYINTIPESETPFEMTFLADQTKRYTTGPDEVRIPEVTEDESQRP